MKITDETLTAYLDGELDDGLTRNIKEMSLADTSLAARLASLQFDRDALVRDYAALSDDAPVDLLRAGMGDTADTETTRISAGRKPGWMMAAACAACLMIGALMGAGAGWFTEADKSWREAVAEYQVLYATETLAWNSVPATEIDDTLKRLSDRVGVQLTRQKLEVSGTEFRRGQMLRFGQDPLVQIAYLHDGKTPVAFCMTPEAVADYAPKRETREGLPIVHWAKGGVSYMVIGDIPAVQLSRMADVLQVRF
jgi:anti-sigma factor RsiW